MVGEELPKQSRLLILFVLFVLSALLWFLNFSYPNVYLQKASYSILALAVTYLIFEVLFEELVTKRIREAKTRYSLRKVISIVSLGTFLTTILIIWIAETNVVISVGLIGAAIAFAIQDLFRNFVGGIIVHLNGLYRVGDRVQINDKYGDVIDISILYTTLMEIREWVAADQVTGRLTIIPNGIVLGGTTQNYTRDFDFIWDELTIPITYDSDWNQANNLILEIIRKETQPEMDSAQKTMEKIEGRYYFTKRSLEPAIFFTLTDNWITFGVRYVTNVRNRRVMHDRLSRIILGEIEKLENVKIASATLNITKFPPVYFNQEKEEGKSLQEKR
jgi:small-conductance mechanosensitive channel